MLSPIASLETVAETVVETFGWRLALMRHAWHTNDTCIQMTWNMSELFLKHVKVIRAQFDWMHMIVLVTLSCSTCLSVIYPTWIFISLTMGWFECNHNVQQFHHDTGLCQCLWNSWTYNRHAWRSQEPSHQQTHPATAPPTGSLPLSSHALWSIG